MLNASEDLFVARARTPKGQRALRSVFSAIRSAVASSGLDAASLQEIAGRAGLSQAALRHYFRTREELLMAFFASAAEAFRTELFRIVTSRDGSAHQVLEQCVKHHLGFMEQVDTVFWLETSAYGIRQASARAVRNKFYLSLIAQYARLIGEIQPKASLRQRQEKATAVVSLVLGAWITHGRGSAWCSRADVVRQRQMLTAAAMSLAQG